MSKEVRLDSPVKQVEQVVNSNDPFPVKEGKIRRIIQEERTGPNYRQKQPEKDSSV